MKTKSNINLLFMGLIVFTFITVNSSAQLNWEKYADNPIIEGSLPEWDVSKWSPVVIHEDGIFKMWYGGYNFENLTYQIGYGVSEDGINWSLNEDPVIPSGNWGAWDYWRMPGTVLRINDTLRMWYMGSTYNWGTHAIGYAWAVEENAWNVLPDPIVVKGEPGTWDDQHVDHPRVHYDGAMYHMYYTGWGDSIQIGYATSTDGVNWDKDYVHNPVISLGENGSFYDAALISSGLIAYNDTIRMFFTGYDGTTTYPPEYSYFRVGYAWSTDYVNWTVGNNMEPVVDVGDPGEWDDRWVRVPWVMVHDGRLKMWYTGFTFYEPMKIGYALGDFITGLPHIIHVPGDYPTIQQGIDAANNYDTVLVSDGMYYEQINFLGKKPLMVASEFLMDGDTNHIANTIIDGSQLTNLDSASVVYFVSGEDTTSILAGFTIRDGKGTIYNPGLIFRGGGGIFIAGSGAKILNNHITENHLSDTISGNANVVTGAGIYYKWEENDNWVVIDHNLIDHNSCYSSGAEAGSVGADIVSNARISYNTFANNEAIGAGNCNAIGAGFSCWTDASWNDTVIAYIQHNVIKDNLSIAQNGFANSAGGFIYTIIGIFTDNIVKNNQVIVNNNPSGGAAGIYVLRPLEGTVVCHNTFRENNCNKFGGALCVESYANNPNVKMVLVENNYFLDNHANDGGAFVSFYNPVTLQNNVFSLNDAANLGGAVYLHTNLNPTYNIPHLATFINNSFYGNKSDHTGGAIYSFNAKPLIFNSIFTADTANLGKEIYVQSTDTVEIGFSDIDPNFIQGGIFIDGGGNINENPLFEDLELLTISENSPCVNTGIEEYYCHCGDLNECPHYDIIGTYRPHGGYVDMGAYEFDFGTGIKPHAFQPATDWHSVFPNPFTEKAMLSYELDSKTKVEINLYNSSGELIQTLLSEQQEAGKQELQFSSGNLPAGIYFYRITTDSKQATGRMILMK